jgi:hypothetical protein
LVIIISTGSKSTSSPRTVEFHTYWSRVRLLGYECFFIFRLWAVLRCRHGSSKWADRQLACEFWIKIRTMATAKTNAEGKKLEDNPYGLRAIIDNPSVPAFQAWAICQPQAQNAKRQASQSQMGGNSSFRCNRIGGLTRCNSGISGGMWGGLAAGLGPAMSGRSAFDAVMSSCLAQYGWRE